MFAATLVVILAVVVLSLLDDPNPGAGLNEAWLPR